MRLVKLLCIWMLGIFGPNMALFDNPTELWQVRANATGTIPGANNLDAGWAAQNLNPTQLAQAHGQVNPGTPSGDGSTVGGPALDLVQGPGGYVNRNANENQAYMWHQLYGDNGPPMPDVNQTTQPAYSWQAPQQQTQTAQPSTPTDFWSSYNQQTTQNAMQSYVDQTAANRASLLASTPAQRSDTPDFTGWSQQDINNWQQQHATVPQEQYANPTELWQIRANQGLDPTTPHPEFTAADYADQPYMQQLTASQGTQTPTSTNPTYDAYQSAFNAVNGTGGQARMDRLAELTNQLKTIGDPKNGAYNPTLANQLGAERAKLLSNSDRLSAIQTSMQTAVPALASYLKDPTASPLSTDQLANLLQTLTMPNAPTTASGGQANSNAADVANAFGFDLYGAMNNLGYNNGVYTGNNIAQQTQTMLNARQGALQQMAQYIADPANRSKFNGAGINSLIGDMGGALSSYGTMYKNGMADLAANAPAVAAIQQQYAQQQAAVKAAQDASFNQGLRNMGQVTQNSTLTPASFG